MSPPEALLWQHLRGSKLGFKVRRQHPIGPYIADFYIGVARLVIEIDGRTHDFGDRPDRDVRRDTYMEDQGYGIVRIDAGDVRKDLDSVLMLIADRVANPLHHQALLDGPPPRAGEEL